MESIWRKIWFACLAYLL